MTNPVFERIEADLKANPVVLFMKGQPSMPQCGFSAKAVGALQDLGVEFAHVNVLEGRGTKGTDKQLEKARSQIRDRLTQLAPIFLKNKFMLGDDFSMLDVAIAPLLWRLDYYGIDLSKNAAPLLKYAERIFSRPAYIEALTPSEKVMRR